MDESLGKKSKENGKPTTQSYLIANQIYPRSSKLKSSPINTFSSPIVREPSHQYPTKPKKKISVLGDSHLKRLSKQLFNYSIRYTYPVIKKL